MRHCSTYKAMIIVLATILSQVCDASSEDKEYQIKAAFLYNFIKFVDWPSDKIEESNDVFVIDIAGRTNPFGNAFDAVANERIQGRKIIIRHRSFDKLKELRKKDQTAFDQEIESIKKCHVLFICSSESGRTPELIELVRHSHVLTVGESKDFLDRGGSINFVRDEKIGFEISLAAAEQAGIKIRSQLLRVARRVVESSSEAAKKE